jgi:hypothetical protein
MSRLRDFPGTVTSSYRACGFYVTSGYAPEKMRRKYFVEWDSIEHIKGGKSWQKNPGHQEKKILKYQEKK